MLTMNKAPKSKANKVINYTSEYPDLYTIVHAMPYRIVPFHASVSDESDQ